MGRANMWIAVTLVAATLLASQGLKAQELKILCAGGMKEVITELQPQFERVTGKRVTVSLGEAGDLRKRLQSGEYADVLVLPKVVLTQVIGDGSAMPNTALDMGQSAIGIGVLSELPKPDIGTPDALKNTFIAARKIVITDPSSGGVAAVHIAEVFRQLGISDQVKSKLILTRGQRNAEFVARGEADVAIQLSNEIRIVPRIEFIPLPKGFDRTFIFSAALSTRSSDVPSAQKILDFLSAPEAVAIILMKGWEPVSGN